MVFAVGSFGLQEEDVKAQAERKPIEARERNPSFHVRLGEARCGSVPGQIFFDTKNRCMSSRMNNQNEKT